MHYKCHTNNNTSCVSLHYGDICFKFYKILYNDYLVIGLGPVVQN